MTSLMVPSAQPTLPGTQQLCVAKTFEVNQLVLHACARFGLSKLAAVCAGAHLDWRTRLKYCLAFIHVAREQEGSFTGKALIHLHCDDGKWHLHCHQRHTHELQGT